jgi:hypothetical protein
MTVINFAARRPPLAADMLNRLYELVLENITDVVEDNCEDACEDALALLGFATISAHLLVRDYKIPPHRVLKQVAVAVGVKGSDDVAN